MSNNKDKNIASIDGQYRSQELEKEINDYFLTTFSAPAGKKVLKYLRTITIESVAGPNITDTELRHREGMRFIVGLIETRIKGGEYERSRSTK
tara:strand:- start:30004 stop:30282 length:279 start_codon:yes stop_codon:yes gene_type:complete